MVPKKQKRQLATMITETMATWPFIFIFLLLCGIEIWWNATSLIPATWQFDKTMLMLNTILSLLAAIQGSIIMIDARMADKKRDNLLARIDSTTKRIEKLERKDTHV